MRLLSGSAKPETNTEEILNTNPITYPYESHETVL